MGSAEDVASAYGAQSEQPLARPQSKLVEANQRAQKKQKVSTTKSVISSVKKTSLYHSTAKRIPNVDRSAVSKKSGVRKKVHCLTKDCKCYNRAMHKYDSAKFHGGVVPAFKYCTLVPFADDNYCEDCKENTGKSHFYLAGKTPPG